MAILKVPLVARRVEYIEAALEKLVHELGSAEGVRRQRVLAWIASAQEELRKRGLLTIH